MKQIKYTEEILKNQLMHHMGYSATQAERLIEMYRYGGELDDLAAVVETKQNASSRL